MNHDHDDLGGIASNEPVTPPTKPGLTPTDRIRGTKPFTGGYYWFPTPSTNGITWSIVTCRDLGCNSDADFWPRLMVPLAAAWSKDAQILKTKLALSYTGLPRGRVTRPNKTFLILHGEDSPVPMWEQLVIESLRLTGRQVKFLFDEHEARLRGHSRMVEAILNPRLIKTKG